MVWLQHVDIDVIVAHHDADAADRRGAIDGDSSRSRRGVRHDPGLAGSSTGRHSVKNGSPLRRVVRLFRPPPKPTQGRAARAIMKPAIANSQPRPRIRPAIRSRFARSRHGPNAAICSIPYTNNTRAAPGT